MTYYTSPQQFLNFYLILSLLPTCAPFSCSKGRVVGGRGPATPQHFNLILSLLLPLSCSERSRVVGVHCKAGEEEEEEEVGARAAPPHLSSPPTWTQASPARTVTLFTCHPPSLPIWVQCQFEQVEHLSVGRSKSVKPGLKSEAIISFASE